MKYFITILLLTIPFSANCRDNDEPFSDSYESNPSEGLRRVVLLMNRLKKNDVKDVEELEKIQKLMEERFTRALIAIEKKSQQLRHSNSSRGQGESSSSNSRAPQGSQKNDKRNTDSGMDNYQGSNEGDQSNKRQNTDDNSKERQRNQYKNLPKDSLKSKNKKNNVQDEEKWGQLPPKIRESLTTNLGRDVPEEIEEDMKDFSKRMKELK